MIQGANHLNSKEEIKDKPIKQNEEESDDKVLIHYFLPKRELV